MTESIVWGDNRPFNPEPACAAEDQPYESEWYADYHIMNVDFDDTWDAFSWCKERLGYYSETNRSWAARVPMGEKKMHFYIRDLDEFLLFKLTWA